MSEENNKKKVCVYDKSMHSTQKADKFHIDKCVMKTMAKMGNKQQCIRYMSGVMNANNVSKSCSIQDIHNICDDHKNNFSLEDAQKLCKIKNDASKQFWCEKNKLGNCNDDDEKKNIQGIEENINSIPAVSTAFIIEELPTPPVMNNFDDTGITSMMKKVEEIEMPFESPDMQWLEQMNKESSD